MKRREFLVRATIGGVSVPLLVSQIGCGDDEEGPGPGPGGGTEFVSGQASGHTHSITIADSELEAGNTRTYTSTSVGHTHTVTISDTDFDQLKRGCRISKPSSQSDGHTHTWEIRYARGNDFDVTSTPDATLHTHMVTIAVADINTPPATRSYDTDEVNLHTHTVTLNSNDFVDLQDCLTVQVVSSPGGVDSHTHSFSIARP
jgi:hypothetical protein